MNRLEFETLLEGVIDGTNLQIAPESINGEDSGSWRLTPPGRQDGNHYKVRRNGETVEICWFAENTHPTNHYVSPGNCSSITLRPLNVSDPAVIKKELVSDYKHR